ncbi:MAG: ATP-binding protein [Paracoccaceae bacterium]
MAAGAYLERVARTIAALGAHAAVRVDVACDEVALPVETTTSLGLLLTELLANALGHAFEGREEGLVRVRLHRLAGGRLRLAVEDDGVGLPEGSRWPEDARVPGTEAGAGACRPGIGGGIVRELAASLGAGLSVVSTPRGTRASIDLDAPAMAPRRDDAGLP